VTPIAKLVPSGEANGIRPKVYRTVLTKQAQYEIERLTESLFYRTTGLHNRSVLMVDLGGKTSSLWVATGVASVLGNALNKMVYVLAICSNASEIRSASTGSESESCSSSCYLEYIAEPTSTPDGMNALTNRLSAIKTDGHMAIVHLAQLKEPAINLPRMDFVDGVLLLVRAAHTHRAALEAIGRQAAKTGTPLLGSILLDRVYPIPKKLYRML
jgi:hypothetical protein